jgi:hypothetical protein
MAISPCSFADRSTRHPVRRLDPLKEGSLRRPKGPHVLFENNEHIEQVDRLVRRIARQQGLQSEMPNEVVALVNDRLAKNRATGSLKRH